MGMFVGEPSLKLNEGFNGTIIYNYLPREPTSLQNVGS
jgi:hypothetical protein